MITTLHIRDGYGWFRIGILTDIGGQMGSDKLDFPLRGLGAYPISSLSTACPQSYRLRHNHTENMKWDRLYEFDAVVAAFDEDASVLTLKLTSEAIGPMGCTE